MNRAALVAALWVLAGVSLTSCGGSSSKGKPPSGLNQRLLVSQSVAAGFTSPALVLVNGFNNTLTTSGGISGGSSPTIMAVSPTRTTLVAYDSAGHSVQIINTQKESNTGSIPLPTGNGQISGITTSIVLPATAGVGYVADPVAGNALWTSPGAVVVMNLTANGITTEIGVPGAQTIVSNQAGTQLLVFSNDSNSISVVSPNLAVPPTDQGCDVTGNPVCTVVSGFDRPVGAVINGNTAYVLNCGAECGGTQASVQILDLTASPLTAGAKVPVDGATVAFLQGSTLYVAGTSPTNNACTGQTTAATTCGRLDIVDLGSMKVTNSIVIPDGYHTRMDMGLGGQFFVGSTGCTEIGDVNNPSGEVRGCLAIYDTTKAGNATAIIPPDNGDVTALQGFTTYYKEYVAEGGNLRIYDTMTDKLLINSIITNGTILITGQVIDIKQIDFF